MTTLTAGQSVNSPSSVNYSQVKPSRILRWVVVMLGVFTVVADREAGEREPPWLARYEQGIELYRGRKFAEGADAFAHCLREQPGDHLSQLYLDACRELMANPPGLDWDTVVIMKTK